MVKYTWKVGEKSGNSVSPENGNDDLAECALYLFKVWRDLLLFPLFI